MVSGVGSERSGDGWGGLPVGRLNLDQGDVQTLGTVDVVVVERVMFRGCDKTSY